MSGCVSGLVEKRRLSGDSMPLLGGGMLLSGVLLGVIGGVKLMGRRPHLFRFFHPLCDRWLVEVLLPKLQALINVGCSKGTTHMSSL
jgi:hypothetical protein